MGISMIWAMDRNRLIGKDNGMPWRLPNDMAFFVKQTTGKTVVMGRKTFESIGSKPLPKRHNVVLTRNKEWTHEGVDAVHSIEDVLKLAPAEDVIIMGGAEVYKQFMPYADQLYVTYIDAEFEGDEYFPPFDESKWTIVEERSGSVDERNLYAHRFVIYKR
ncbi:dihydrofolate reductase [Paenibacillus marinisediminis]